MLPLYSCRDSNQADFQRNRERQRRRLKPEWFLTGSRRHRLRAQAEESGEGTLRSRHFETAVGMYVSTRYVQRGEAGNAFQCGWYRGLCESVPKCRNTLRDFF